MSKAHWEKLSKLTQDKCMSCPITEHDGKYRCCDKLFCTIVMKDLNKKGIKYETTGHSIPFMGETGCVLPPELRPFCTGFVCPTHLENKSFRREYKKLCRRVGIFPMQRKT